ncbi:thiamine ABC transporter substrate-binding protein [Nocardioides mangrovicus]|uniref:Thiamine ABC transporter substrate-binding protein n=1 Tax=Nocardioides mangrovicus TaxID=2478913 RepID=A0A3L8P5I0_9ACTN|nr:thiamine ABC transporter substrate-binding protein [Nocardioides mangrovicus]RLV50431.1 thiamine ABC transporter substrate-binding protein [Nocardioides mangrovicus]
MRRILLLLVPLAALSGCAFSGGGEDAPKTVTLVTHDSWAMDKGVIAAFEKKTGYRVRTVASGDAGALVNKLVLTKSDPIGDAVYGIDNTFASRAVDAGVLADHTASLPTSAEAFRPSGEAAQQLTPIDYGDVCMNVDNAWYTAHHQTPPATLDDLTKPAYKDQLVVPGPPTSSPGLAFLLTTIAAKGDAWPTYWKALLANGLKVDSGWTEAYETDFTAGGGKGDRPIVLSYASSIPDTIAKGGTTPTTSALLDTCFRQVEYAGVLKGAEHPKIAAELVDFMLTNAFQKQLPSQMYVYPAVTTTALPTEWARWAKVATKPYAIPAEEIAQERTTWLRQWRDLATQ